MNRYAYTSNDPVNNVDRTGLDDDWWIVGDFSVTIIGGNDKIIGMGQHDLFDGVFLPEDGPVDSSIGGISQADARRQEQRRKEQIGVDKAAEMLKEGCATFIDDVIQTAFTLLPVQTMVDTGPNMAVNLYIEARASGRVSATGESGVRTTTLPDGTRVTHTVYGYTDDTDSTIHWNDAFYDLLNDKQRGQHTLHESLHLIPGFTDAIIAQAAKKVANGADIGSEGNSTYFNGILQGKCK